MNMPSQYQASFYRELAKLCDLTVVYSGGLSRQRRELGWVTDTDGYKIIMESNMDLKSTLLLNGESCHLVSGFPGGLTNFLRHTVSPKGLPIATQTEMPVPDEISFGWKVLAKSFVPVIARKRICVLGIGAAVRVFLERLRVPKDLIFPFAYFPFLERTQDPNPSGPIMYVGQLIPRKGVDLLITALTKSKRARSRGLVIVGDGSQKKDLVNQVSRLGLAGAVKFIGAKKSSETKGYIENASCLVLPSRFDGWGVVVNEAILLGVPVIVSDSCGASELVVHGQCGYVFTSGDGDDLGGKLDTLSTNNTIWSGMSEMAKAYSSSITPRNGANYFMSIIDFMREGAVGGRPIPQWFK